METIDARPPGRSEQQRLPVHLATWMVVPMMLLLATAAAAQPAEDCSGMVDLGPVTLPFSGQLLGATADIALNGVAGCEGAGNPDAVACFVPTGNCTVDVTCSGGPTANQVNLMNGPCGTPPSCLASATTSTTSTTLAAQALTAGAEYCVICKGFDLNGSSADLTMAITQVGGSCGALPVDLQRFAVE